MKGESSFRAGAAPAPESAPRRMERHRRLGAILLVWLIGFALTAGLNVLRGATSSGFGWGDDEAAHMVSGVMIHDYLRGVGDANPIEFAKDYYVHYPKVAIGQWPPGYHATQALWTLVFGVSRVSIVLFGSFLAAGVAALVFAALRGVRGPLVAGAGALLYLLLPLVQRYSATPGTEVLVSGLAFAAVLAFARFLERGGWRPAMAFGVLASLAILSKANALALALVPPVALVLRREPRRLLDRALWGAAGLVALVAGPWTLFFLSVSQSTWGGGTTLSLDYSARAAETYGAGLVHVGGPLILLLAVVGAASRLREARPGGLWAASAAWILVGLAFHIVVPSSIEVRHLMLFAPALVLLAAEGAVFVVGLWPRLPAPRAALAGAALLLAGFSLLAWEFPRKDIHGYDEAVAYVRGAPGLEGEVLLVDAGPIGDGLCVSEFVLADDRPEHVVLRATKLLAHASWTGEGYEELYPEPEALAQALVEVPVGLVLRDASTREQFARLRHRETLGRVLAGPDWELLERFDLVRGGRRISGALELWHRADSDCARPPELDFSHIVDRELPGLGSQ